VAYAGAIFICVTFVALARALGIFTKPLEVAAASRQAFQVLSDPALDDDAKEQRMRAHTKTLGRLFVVITTGAIVAVGHSLGTLSAARAAAELERPVEGLVLISPVTLASLDESLAAVPLENVAGPSLIVSNRADQCIGSPPESAEPLKKRFVASRRVQVLFLEGGLTPLDTPCNCPTPHCFFGIEQQMVDAITRSIKAIAHSLHE
jgi:pimeloyl-ACP methyl ester carboxylesterase